MQSAERCGEADHSVGLCRLGTTRTDLSMTTRKPSRGFALLLVLWTLVTLSAVALALAATAGTEIRLTQGSWDDLQAERLAKAGHDFGSYLETRMIGGPTE